MRKEAILRILDKQERPIRQAELYDLLIQEPEGRTFTGLGEPIYWQNFSGLMMQLVDQGLVYRFKPRYENKVFYYITNKGRAFVRPRDMQKLLRRHLRYYIRRLVRHHVSGWISLWNNEEVMEHINDLLPKIKDSEKYFKRYMLSAYIRQKLEYYKDEIFTDRAFRVEQIREHFLPDVTEEQVREKMKQSLKRSIPRAIYQDLIWHDDLEQVAYEHVLEGRLREHICLMKELDPTFDAKAIFEETKQLIKVEKAERRKARPFAYCALCGVRINSAAENFARALHEKTGLEAGGVCCHCYKQLLEEEKAYGASSRSS